MISMMKYDLDINISKRPDSDSQHQNSAHLKNNPIDCVWVSIANAEHHVVHIVIRRHELYNRNHCGWILIS